MDKYRVQIALWSLLFAFLHLSGCASSTTAHDAWFGQDKALHFGCSVVIGASGSAFAEYPYRASDSVAFTIGMLGAVGMGAWKEWYDLRMKGAYWSWKDFFWDILGGSAGSALGTRIR